MPDTSEALLLDTHVWIWLMEGNDRLQPAVRDDLQQAAPGRRLGVSAISIWEVAMLEAKGRIVFNTDCLSWVSRALEAPGISLVPLHAEIAVASTRLPGDFHGDPADRILVATARQYRWTLVTADDAIITYGACGHVRVTAA